MVVLFMNTRPLISFCVCVVCWFVFFFPQVSQVEDKEMGLCWELVEKIGMVIPWICTEVLDINMLYT